MLNQTVRGVIESGKSEGSEHRCVCSHNVFEKVVWQTPSQPWVLARLVNQASILLGLLIRQRTSDPTLQSGKGGG